MLDISMYGKPPGRERKMIESDNYIYTCTHKRGREGGREREREGGREGGGERERESCVNHRHKPDTLIIVIDKRERERERDRERERSRR